MNNIFDLNTYSVAFAERRDIGEEWNEVKWNRNHFHVQYHRLYFPTSGRAEIRLLNKTIELECGRVYFIPAYSVTESRIAGQMNKFYVHFQVDSPFFELYRYMSDTYSVEANSHTEYLFNTVLENYSDKSMVARHRVQGAMNLIMADFFKDISVDRRSILKFEPVLAYVSEHYRENIRLSTLAGLINVSTMYFSNAFKKVFNISPKQFILNKRLTESQRLLLETEMSVKEIAYAVGFENESYFSEFFSAKVGISALRFRNREAPKRDSIL